MNVFSAIENSDKELLEKLIKSGIDVNISDEYGQTPLHLAIDTAFEEAIYIYDTEGKFVQPRMDIIEILLKNGADSSKADKEGKKAIDWAKERKNEIFINDLKSLIEKNTAHRV